MQNAALIGGSRFIGVHLLSALEKTGYQVTIFNRNICRSPIPYPSNAQYIIGDRNNVRDLDKLFENNFDIVFDLCGYTPQHVKPIVLDYRSQIGHYIFCSTASVYKTPPPNPFNEDSQRLLEANTYGGDKSLAEDILLNCNTATGWPVTIFRPQGVFGPYDPWRAGFVFHRAKSSLPIFHFNNHHFRANPVFVDDLVTAFISAANNSISHGAIYGVAGDDIVNPVDFVELCGTVSSTKPIQYFENNPSQYSGIEVEFSWLDHDLVADNSRVKWELGVLFTPLEDALYRTFQWLQEHPRYLKKYSFAGEKYILNRRRVPTWYKIYNKTNRFFLFCFKKMGFRSSHVSWMSVQFRRVKRILLFMR